MKSRATLLKTLFITSALNLITTTTQTGKPQLGKGLNINIPSWIGKGTRSLTQEYLLTNLDDAPEVINNILKDDVTLQEAQWLEKIKDAINGLNKSKNKEDIIRVYNIINDALKDLAVENRAVRSANKDAFCCPSLRSAIITLLFEIQNELRQCCQDLTELINQKLACSNHITISEVPVTLDVPGNYCVAQDLVYEGNDVAIMIAADNVTLDFNNHELMLPASFNVGVMSLNTRNTTIKNGSITSVQDQSESIALYLGECQSTHIQNLNFKNIGYGPIFESCKDNTITSCNLSNATYLGFIVIGSSNSAFYDLNVTSTPIGLIGDGIDNCTINNYNALNCDSAFLLGAGSPCNNVHITNLSSYQQLQTNRFAGNGLVIDEMTANAALTNSTSLLQLGSFIPEIGFGLQAENVIIKNSSFNSTTNTDGSGGAGALFALSFSDLSINDCIFVSNSTGLESIPLQTVINLGDPAAQATLSSNAILTNCVIDGAHQASVGIYVASGTEGVIIDNSVINAAAWNNIVIDTQAQSVVLKNSSVNNSLLFGAWIKGDKNNFINTSFSNNGAHVEGAYPVVIDGNTNNVSTNVFTGNGAPNVSSGILNNGTNNNTQPNIVL